MLLIVYARGPPPSWGPHYGGLEQNSLFERQQPLLELPDSPGSQQSFLFSVRSGAPQSLAQLCGGGIPDLLWVSR